MRLERPSGPPACWTSDPEGGFTPAWTYTTLAECRVAAFALPELTTPLVGADGGGGGGSFATSVDVAAVPLPGGFGLLLVALAGLLLWRRRA